MTTQRTAENLCARIEHKLLCLWVGKASEVEVRGLLREAVEEIDRLRRGEFICKKCGIRKDSDESGASHEF